MNQRQRFSATLRYQPRDRVPLANYLYYLEKAREIWCKSVAARGGHLQPPGVTPAS